MLPAPSSLAAQDVSGAGLQRHCECLRAGALAVRITAKLHSRGAGEGYATHYFILVNIAMLAKLCSGLIFGDQGVREFLGGNRCPHGNPLPQSAQE